MKSRTIVLSANMVFGILAAVVGISLFSLAGCAGSLVSSKWRFDQIKVDGDAQDWSDSTAYFGTDDVGLKITNDDEFLYLLLVTHKREIARQMVTRGLIIWFDPNGGDKKTIGLHYPVGMGVGGRFQQGPNGQPEGMDQGRMGGQNLQELEFLGPTERDRVRMTRTQGKGVEVQIGEHNARFVYEAKIPLIFSLNHPYAIETSTGSTIGLTIESSIAGARESLAGQGGQGGAGVPGGGRGGRGGGGGRGGIGGGGGQAQRGNDGTQFEPIKVKIRLAEQVVQK